MSQKRSWKMDKTGNLQKMHKRSFGLPQRGWIGDIKKSTGKRMCQTEQKFIVP